VDFDFLDSLNVKLREIFTILQLEQFCYESTMAHPKFTAYFYSNLSFLDVNRFSFSVQDQDYIVDMDTSADVIGVERRAFQSISVSVGRATVELVRDGMTEGRISYLRMNASNILLHKIMINCLRPKSTSKTDVSNSEAKLMYAINAGIKFSLPHKSCFTCIERW